MPPAALAQSLAQVDGGVEEIGVEFVSAAVARHGFVGPAGLGHQQAAGVVCRGEFGIELERPADGCFGVLGGARIEKRQRQRIFDLGIVGKSGRAPQVFYRLGTAPGQTA